MKRSLSLLFLGVWYKNRGLRPPKGGLPMKLVSWNVNGLRACLGKGFLTFCGIVDADVICLQETKMRPEQAEFELPGYTRYWNSAD